MDYPDVAICTIKKTKPAAHRNEEHGKPLTHAQIAIQIVCWEG